jgi:hypothetical protein
MDYREIRNIIGSDPLFMAYVNLARSKNITNPSLEIHSGKIWKTTGRYTMISHCVIECLMYALSDSPKNCWKLFLFLMRNISGRTREGNNNLPQTNYILEPNKIMKKANIKGVSGFYNAIKKLKEKNMVYQNDNILYLNLFPNTWNIEDEYSKNRIREIVECEIHKLQDSPPLP